MLEKIGKLGQKQKMTEFQWTDEHQKVFSLNACLTSAPVIGHPDFSHPFELEMDASLQGLGAVLSHMGTNTAQAGLLAMLVGPCSTMNVRWGITVWGSWDYLC